MQLSLISNWVDGRVAQPADGQKVLAYTWIENPDDQLPMFKALQFEYDGMTISGPTVTRYEKKFVNEGLHRKVALWQPIEPLPEAT